MDLERAIQIAADAHRGQKDKAGQPYILHPLRVLLACALEGERIVAALHDVVEDSEWTLDGLRDEGLADDLADAVDAMTRREEETYAEFVDRASRNPIARAVKIADLRDNLETSRKGDPTGSNLQRAQKYQEALNMLGVPSA